MDISTFLISKPYPKYSQGLSIIEIMVALMISSILMAGVYTIFSNSKKTYLLQGEMAELNDNARFIMDEFKHVISKSGYAGCQGSYINPFLNSQDNQTIQGVPNSTAFPTSDILDINNFFEPLNVKEPNIQLTNPITLDTNSLVPNQGDEIFIGNCNFAPESHTVSTLTPAPTPWDNPIIDVGSLNQTYNPPYDIYRQNRLIYQVEALSSGRFRLLKCINNNTNCNPLIEGVQNMQIRYGIDTDGNRIPDQYVDANTMISLANNVISLRVTLLMRTINKRGIGTPGNPKTFNLDSDLSTPSNLFDETGLYNPHKKNTKREEGYRHRLFTTTIFVRNSIYPL